MSLSVIPVSNETKNTSHRTTKDGRRIRYDMQVIQQPERARACGSGAKSSADRRPVDPPPIVELRIFENDQDVTFAYNANFFLHASLENARPLAAGRTAPSISGTPVLTGTPVAGMAYLDRPTPAGYFIFPDLSVRHEGKYRLSFALLENLSEVKDLDPDDPNVIHDGNRFVTNRCEVKSAPFTVFSAKKFPGLSESTALSRMVAEQGCRVRIRRDVRMRRRENKSSKEWDGYDEENEYGQQARRTPTPETYGGQPGMPAPGAPMDERPRSVSNASNSSLAPPRRPSMDEMAQAYQQPNTNYQQMPPPQNAGYSHMPSQPQYQPQYQQQQQYAPPPASHMMQPPQPSYSQPHQQQPQHQPQPAYNGYQTHTTMPMNQSYGYPNHQQPQQSHYEPRQEQPAAHHQPIDYRRPSIPQPTQQYAPSSQPQLMSPYSPVDPYQQRSQSMSHPMQPMQTPARPASISGPSSMHPHNSHALPTLKTLQPPIGTDKLTPVSPSYNSPMNTMSSGTVSANSDTSNSNYALHNYPASNLPPMSSTAGQKRSFSNTFDQGHVTGRLTQAAMSYRRADGTQRQRHVPEVNV
ncbi:sexual development activator VeA [Macroventuria anomochaeta]|uniref:Sexual development activator VeA n=1 Tax=Macroventuria anomochaeta TaxID=301207 RepID=A0ACB6SGJ8_9PLEO|nr:sexual development activator VeA [Macroventuria anomochaeta]KAF2633296.1 sexual development activator VeA [Macroventuria anomochaeta]